MGLFSRRSRKTVGTPSRPPRRVSVVTVAFRDLGTRDPLKNFSSEHGYAYVWPFAEEPRIGRWAIVDGWDGPSTVVVGALGLPESARGIELKPLRRLIPEAEVVAAQAQRDSPAHAWLDLARRAAGLEVTRPLVEKVPHGFDPLPPTDGTASADKADKYGRIWWRAYSLSTELARDPDETDAFKSAGQHWFRQRDQATKAAHERRFARAIASVDLDSAIRDVASRSQADIESMNFAGQPLWDWLKYAQDLDKSGRTDEALALIGALITAAEQEAVVSGREPAPAYTERAAIIHRKRKDYAAEIAVIERWMNACPPEKRGPGATQEKLHQRLDRARELAMKG